MKVVPPTELVVSVPVVDIAPLVWDKSPPLDVMLILPPAVVLMLPFKVKLPVFVRLMLPPPLLETIPKPVEAVALKEMLPEVEFEALKEVPTTLLAFNVMPVAALAVMEAA